MPSEPGVKWYPPASPVVSEMLCVSQVLYAFLHVSVNLTLRQAAQTGELREHGDVIQVVEVAEYADFAEFCDTSQHREPDVPVHGLEHTVKWLEYVAVFLLQGLVADGLEQGLVVLVHEDDHAVSGLLVRSSDDACKAQGQRGLRRVAAVQLFPDAKSIVEYVVEILRFIVSFNIQVYMQYRSCRPLFLQLLYCQSFKQLPLSLKVGLQCGYEQTLSEPPGPAQKVISSLAHQFVDKLSLVYI